MSRIFEALQQSESERAGFVLDESKIAATELLRAAESEIEQGNGDPFASSTHLRSAVAVDSRLIATSDRWSLAAEKFRLLGLRLRQLQQARPPLKKVLVTSTLAQEGKSFVCANLAMTLARKAEQRVLLLEGDLRRPVLAANLGLHHLPGLAEALEHGSSLFKNIHYIEDLKLWFMPAGRPPDNPLELMQGARISEKLEQISGSFDWIIVDSPPLLPLADTNLWSRVVDGVLFVARQGKTEMRQLKRSLELLDKINLVGALINDCESANQQNYYQRYGGIKSDYNAAEPTH